MKRKFLILFISIALFQLSYSQSYESNSLDLAKRIKIYLPINEVATLQGAERFIQIGIYGIEKDVLDFIGYIDGYALNDNDMIIKVDNLTTEEMVYYTKFYLSPFADANNFQQMLEMFKIASFINGSLEQPISVFSNTIYGWIKSNTKKQ